MRLLKTILLLLLIAAITPAYAQPPEGSRSIRTHDPLLQRIAHLEALIFELSNKMETESPAAKQVGWTSPINHIDLGMSLGMQSYVKRPPTYYADANGSLASYQRPSNFRPVLSAYFSRAVGEAGGIMVSFPLLEVSQGDATNIGLFTGRYALGLGYEYRLSGASVYASLNFASFPVVIEDIVKHKVFVQEPFTTIDIGPLPTYTAYTIGFGFGVSIPLLTSRLYDNNKLKI